ncbi:MAG: GIY-YIG nuclease family protein [Anaerolineae bacterium]|nr:GIY-YIG nuclease family protein [Anaerolineae bacterium]
MARPPAAPVIHALPAKPGAYLLWFELGQPLTLAVGRLGTVTLPAGRLVYVGSALGPGGLRSRLGRHFSRPAARRWHVDYLTAAQPPCCAWFVESRERLECAWATALTAWGAVAPVPGFGSSDCPRPGCQAHLLWLPPGLPTPTPEDLPQCPTHCYIPS